MNTVIKKLIVVGGGTAGWMTAAALSRFLHNSQTHITLIESDAIGTVGVGEATIPAIQNFNKMLGIDEGDFIRQTKGTYKLGIEFIDWLRVGHSYFHPFGYHGYDIEGIPFHHYWLRLAHGGDPTPIDEYSFCWQAARAGKFLRPVDDPQSPLSHLRYAYHFDASLYAAYLRRYAETRGVNRIEGKVVDVEQSSDTRNIAAVRLEDGTSLEGDFFVDCTGFRSLLLGQTLGVEFDDWSKWLPCNRAIAVPSRRQGPARPYTRATAKAAGWQWQIPLQHRNGNGYVYCSDRISDDDALFALLNSIDGEVLADPNYLRFTAGRRQCFWKKNCVAIGLSAGFLEPLESTSIHLIQEGVAKLIALFPNQSIVSSETEKYNQIIGGVFDYIRNFLVLHYNATERTDTAFWDTVRTMPIPDELSRILDLFGENGRFFAYDGDLFSTTSWVAVLLGQGIEPKSYDPMSHVLDLQEVKDSLADMRAVYAEAVRRMPPHDAFIEHISTSKPSTASS